MGHASVVAALTPTVSCIFVTESYVGLIGLASIVLGHLINPNNHNVPRPFSAFAETRAKIRCRELHGSDRVRGQLLIIRRVSSNERLVAQSRPLPNVIGPDASGELLSTTWSGPFPPIGGSPQR